VDQSASDPANAPIRFRARVVADGDLSEERLFALIALDGEEDALDCKRTYDLSQTGDTVKCVRVLV
jgi:hypothetical protein